MPDHREPPRTAQVILSRAAEGEDFTPAVAEALAARGHAVLITPPVEHLAEDSPLWERVRARGGPLLVASSLHTRALRALLARHGVEGAGLTALRSADFTTVEEFISATLDALGGSGAAGEGVVEEPEEATQARWFPVIDPERCRNCGNCFQFCLFGVYEQDAEGRVRVAQPDECKPGCPACARICPAGAVIFPLYDRDPAICGAPGQYVTLDEESRRMFQERTAAECPVCGPEGDPALTDAGLTACPECGRELAPESPVFDEIDALITELDDWSRRSM